MQKSLAIIAAVALASFLSSVAGQTAYNDGGSALLEVSRGGRAVREVYYKRSNEVQNHHGGMILLDGKVYMGH